MQNTERVVMKRNNHPVFIDEFTDNVVDYLLWFSFLWRATLNLLEQLRRLVENGSCFQSSAMEVNTPSGMNT